MKKVGIFGGTFDPIHFGHINLIIEMLEKSDLNEILICPAFLSPHKLDKPPLTKAFDRMKMTEIAIEDIQNVSVSDVEIKRKGISYTIDTLRGLKEKFYDIRLIIAEDSLPSFDKWKDYKEILKIAPPLIGCRAYFESLKVPEGITSKNFIRTKQFEITSTEIRERLKKNFYVKHLLPSKVLDYIIENDLY
jgi:nicotinate-nucleotide adenylyltransferase